VGVTSQNIFHTACREAAVKHRYNFWKAGPLKFGTAKKTSKIQSDFFTTFDFDREYLRNDSRYPKSERNVIDSASSLVPWKKSGEPWSTNKKVLLANFEPPKCIFGGDYILALRGCCPLKFLYAIEIDQALIVHTQVGMGSSKKTFDIENLKFGLKFSVCAPITSGIVGIFSPNFSRPRDELWSTNENVIERILIHPICSYTVI